MGEPKKGNPQIEAPSKSLFSFRGRINPNSGMTVREQIQEYHRVMGKNALARQIIKK